MPCVEPSSSSLRRWPARLIAMSAACLSAWLVGCATKAPEGTTPAGKGTAPRESKESASKSPSGILPPPSKPRSMADARQQAARRLVAANPDMTYMGKPPDILMAIPVLTVELNGDGSIRNIDVMRYPSRARETVDMAIKAIKRAAPFGDVSHLPKPWRFNETFLFNDQYKFKPMTLDQR